MNIRAPVVLPAEAICAGDVIELRFGDTLDRETHAVEWAELAAGLVRLHLSNRSTLYLSRRCDVVVWRNH